jgi:hypothetical protein
MSKSAPSIFTSCDKLHTRRFPGIEFPSLGVLGTDSPLSVIQTRRFPCKEGQHHQRMGHLRFLAPDYWDRCYRSMWVACEIGLRAFSSIASAGVDSISFVYGYFKCHISLNNAVRSCVRFPSSPVR